MPVIKRS